MSSINLFYSNAFLPASDLHRSISRRFSIQFNGGRMRACLAVDVQKASHSTRLGFEVASKEVMEADERVIVGIYARTLAVFSSGKGYKLYDVEEREYLDLTFGIAVNALSHGDLDWIRAVTDQAYTLTKQILCGQVEGREYLDLTFGIVVNADLDWIRAVIDQVKTLTKLIE